MEDFTFDDKSGKLICPAGHGMYVRNRNFVNADGHKAIAYQAPKTACRGCALRSKCLRNPDTVSRQVHVFYGKRPGSITDEMKRKIDTPEGRRTYSKRWGIVEPVFGNIRSCKKMDRFTLRGRIKVNIQWLLYCLVHNSQLWEDLRDGACMMKGQERHSPSGERMMDRALRYGETNSLCPILTILLRVIVTGILPC